MELDYITIVYYIMWGLLVFTSIFFLISGVDDLFFDFYYWKYSVWRFINIRKKSQLTYEELAEKPQQRIAVMIPCWHEAGVIEEMLRYNTYSIDYENYDLFVGVYSNDPHTVAAVQSMCEIFPHIKCVIGPDPGPTNKASNLNSVAQYIHEHEIKNNIKYDIFVMHDSEDVIHPYGFLLFNYLMPKNDMIQIPIFPLEVKWTNFTHWTYNAEFAEIHTKDIIVREKIGGLVPSAGVGTAFTRSTIELLKKVRGGVPFSTYSLTEDYSTALEIKLHNLRQIFVLQHVQRTAWRKKWFFFGRMVSYRVREYIATRAVFPLTYFQSVRQKTRWVLGINFQELIHTGWKGNFATEYTLLHDRKSMFTLLVNGLFFIQVPFWILYSSFAATIPDLPSLQDAFESYPWVMGFIYFTSFLMINRIVQRGIAVFRVYGLFAAIFSIPLILYANIINMHALLRAYYQFLFSSQAKTKTKTNTAMLKWDKTDHTFPKHDLLARKQVKLGELLLENKMINKNQLIHAVSEQGKTGEKLGQVLLRLKYTHEKQILEIIAGQYHLDLIPKSHVKTLPFTAMPYISKYTYDRLNINECYPIKIENNQMTLAIYDPSNELTLNNVQRWIRPYQAVFVMISPD